MLYMLSVVEVALCLLLHAAWQRAQRWLLTTLRCAEEVQHLDSENQVLRSKHDKIVEEHAKTLERIDELWKQKWKINWDGVSVQTDGCAWSEWILCMPESWVCSGLWQR